MDDEKWRVTAAREIQPKLAPVTLHIRGIHDSKAGTIYFPYTYLRPSTIVSGHVSASGAAVDETIVAIYQEGQTHQNRPTGYPQADDVIEDATDNKWQVNKVETTMNYAPLYAVHRCTITRMG
jgi:hypothetical protein